MKKLNYNVSECKKALEADGVIVLKNFLSDFAVRELQNEAKWYKKDAFKSSSSYNAYVLPQDTAYPADSARNKLFTTTKSCLPYDLIPKTSILRQIYNSEVFKEFLCKVIGVEALYPYGDPLSSININYYDVGDSLEWHFDNSDFALTLLIQQCEDGGIYEYFKNNRLNKLGEENYDGVLECINGVLEPRRSFEEAGSLMIFRGNKSLHRVTEIKKGERILVTFNYNTKPDIPLSEQSRMTFFGRVG